MLYSESSVLFFKMSRARQKYKLPHRESWELKSKVSNKWLLYLPENNTEFIIRPISSVYSTKTLLPSFLLAFSRFTVANFTSNKTMRGFGPHSKNSMILRRGKEKSHNAYSTPAHQDKGAELKGRTQVQGLHWFHFAVESRPGNLGGLVWPHP